MAEDTQYLRWQQGSGPSTAATGDQNDVRSLIDYAYATVSPSHPTWTIDNDLAQAAMRMAKLIASGRWKPEHTPRAIADRHYYRHPGRVVALCATGDASAHNLATAITQDPECQKLIKDKGLKMAGAGIDGNDLNLVLVVMAAEGDPQGTRRNDQERLEQVALRDGLQYGDDDDLNIPEEQRSKPQVWVLQG